MNEAKFLRALEAPYVLDLAIAGIPFQIAVNNEAVGRTVARYFAPFQSSEPFPDPVRVVGIHGEPAYDEERLTAVAHKTGRPKEAFYDSGSGRVILKTRSGVVHYVQPFGFYAVGDLLRYPQQLLNLVATAFGHRLRGQGYVAIHASGVSQRGRGIAVGGSSGSGKSTVSLALLELGYEYVSNDRVFVRRRDGAAEMVGVPKWPRVNPGTLFASDRLRALLSSQEVLRYSRLSRAKLWSVEDKHDVPVANIYGRGSVSLRSRMETLYVLTWSPRRSGDIEVRPVGRGRVASLVASLVKTDVYELPGTSPASPGDISSRFAGVRVFEVSGGADIPALVARIARTTRTEKAVLANSA